jgi:hypothetical protein
MVSALIPFFSALLGGLMAAVANYLVSQRTISRSGARLRADLEILEKAISIRKLDPEAISDSRLEAIEARVAHMVEWHTKSALRKG